MYGKQNLNFLSLIVSRLGHRLGQFVLFVLLMNFMSTAALSASSMGMKDDFQADTGSFVICTPQGLKRISLDENGNPVDDDKGRLEHCVYCLPFQKVALGSSNFEYNFAVANLISLKPRYRHSISVTPDVPLNTACPPRAPPYI